VLQLIVGWQNRSDRQSFAQLNIRLVTLHLTSPVSFELHLPEA
jgi:hypothetical protein